MEATFAKISPNGLAFLIDPLLRFAFLTMSPISVCLFRKEGRLVAKAEAKIARECDVRDMIPKIGFADTLLRGMLKKDYYDLMMYSKTRTIGLDLTYEF